MQDAALLSCHYCSQTVYVLFCLYLLANKMMMVVISLGWQPSPEGMSVNFGWNTLHTAQFCYYAITGVRCDVTRKHDCKPAHRAVFASTVRRCRKCLLVGTRPIVASVLSIPQFFLRLYALAATILGGS